ncbi:hypothetical protein LMG28688_06446 [Paraburkholderia caffeinitolerans]|uniref:Uncharacterized protein n=1 Tax=Paraburkholderia caffeinitolerans TaxID=1723730 RepID=A0A6J5H0N3_9BURK|nr:hypothetical protein LMG28688_06446 [Paraburkholderia caffeinitolerans]
MVSHAKRHNFTGVLSNGEEFQELMPPKNLTFAVRVAYQNLYSGFFGSKASASKVFGVMLSITILSRTWPSLS